MKGYLPIKGGQVNPIEFWPLLEDIATLLVAMSLGDQEEQWRLSLANALGKLRTDILGEEDYSVSSLAQTIMAIYTQVAGSTPGSLPLLSSRVDSIEARALDCQNKLVALQNTCNLILDRIAPGENPPPIVTTHETDLIMSALYYIARMHVALQVTIDDTEIISQMAGLENRLADNDASLQTSLNSLHGVLVQHDTDIKAALENVNVDLQPVLDAIAAIEPGGAGSPLWPGLSGATLSAPVALSDGLRIAAPMDGVIVNITTPPHKTGLIVVGGAPFDYREGHVAFETDNGNLETWQYLGFRSALFTPKTMKRAAAVRFRVLAGAEGVIQYWTNNA